MKNKGIPFVEQHIEKLVLGAAGVVFLSVLAWQVLGTHNNVKLDGRDAAPSEIDEALATRTQALASKLDQPAPPLQDKLGDRLKPQADAFASRLGSAVAPKGELPRIEAALASVLESEGAAVGQPFHVPEFPALAMRPTMQFYDTIESAVVEKTADLKRVFASERGPFDVNWTTPSAVINVKAMRDELASSSNGAQIPGFWYRSRLSVIDIEFQRERRLENGSWGEATIVASLPGQFSFRTEIAKGADAPLRDAVMTYLGDKASQRQLLQPDFYPTKRSNFDPAALLADDTSGEVESKPAVDPAQAKLAAEIAAKKQAVAKLAVQIKRLKEELEDIGGPLEEPGKDDKKDDKKGGGGGGSGGGGGMSRPGGGLGGGGMTGKRTPGEDAAKEKRISLTKKLRSLEDRASKMEKDLASKLEEAGMSASAAPAVAVASSDLSTADSIVVWAHDLGVKAGQEYRYRAVAKVYNPFFTNGALLVDAQRKLSESFTLSSPVSEWGQPVRVLPPVMFFVTDAQVGEGKLGMGQAKVEIWRYFDGERRKQAFTVQPGDAVGGGRLVDNIEFDTGYFVVDIYAESSGDRGGADRKPSAVVVVQNTLGDRYELRLPSDDSVSTVRKTFEVELESAKLASSKQEAESDTKSAPPKAPGGSGSSGGNGRDGDPKYGPKGGAETP